MAQSMATSTGALEWAKVDLTKVPNVVATPPGPKSNEVHSRTAKYMKGFSGQVKLMPVAFESGIGCTLRDVDGNEYIDFSSGIYVTNLGHCHPKVTEAVQKWAGKLMNAHDFASPIKMQLMEKMAEVLPSNLKGFQLYDSGTTAVEAGLRVARAATGKHEFISCFMDFHGKSYGSVSLAQIRSSCYGPTRAPGFHMVPRPNPYRPMWTKADGEIDTDAYIRFLTSSSDAARSSRRWASCSCRASITARSRAARLTDRPEFSRMLAEIRSRKTTWASDSMTITGLVPLAVSRGALAPLGFGGASRAFCAIFL